MKRFMSIVLCMILVLTSVSVTATAEETDNYPLIVVPGYSASYLFTTDKNGNERILWGSFEGLNIVDVVLANIDKLLAGLGGVGFGQPQYLAQTLADGANEILGELAYDKSGNPVVDAYTYPNDPAITNYKYLIEEMGSMHAAETEIMADIAELYGENGYENIFSFQTDFRLNIVDAVEGLRKYIDDVLEYTGAEKVNLFAVSYGGQLSASYLNLYGSEGKVHNAILTVPAIGGAALAYDAVSENVRFDEETLLYFIENGMMLEEDYHWLMQAHSLGFLDELINLLISSGLRNLFGYWGSIWDFIPTEYYEELKKEYLDPVESAELIEKSDYFHYEILPSMTEKLQACINNDTNVYIIAGSDSPAVTGMYEQSDGIIHLNGATGAESAPLDLRYSDGYTGKGTNCSDKTHNHISPAMNIDASVCYLPEQTWFISGLFHGMVWKDEYTRNLCTMLLLAEDTVSVHSYKEYPQFKYSTNVCHTVSAAFDYSKDGYWSAEDSKLIVTNLSDKYDLRLLSVNCYGVDADFDVPCGTVLAPHESVELTFTASLPECSMVTADISINYLLTGSLTPQGVRELTFTVLNGEVTEYNTAEPYATAKHDSDFDSMFDCDFITNILIKSGWFDYIRMLINLFVGFFN